MVEKIGLEAIFKNAAFNKAVSDYMRSLSRMTRQTDVTAGGIGNQFTAMGTMVTRALGATGLAAAGVVTAAGATVAAFGADAVKTSISVESAFAGVVKTTDGLTDSAGELNETGKELKQGFKEVAETVPISVEELMRIGELGGQLGVAKEGLLDFTKVIADIGTATDLTTDEAATGFAQFMNVMGTAQDDVDRLGSTIVDLGNNFATNEPQILAFAQRIAGAGAIAGLTEADVLAIGASMASVGVEAEAGGTAVQKVLLAMQTAALGAGQASGTVINNTEKITKSQDKLADLSSRLAIAQQRLAETTERTSKSTRMSRERSVRNLEAEVAKEQLLLDSLVASHGQLAEESQSQLDTFAKTAGMTTQEFSELWERDAGEAFERFVRGLGEQGDDALGTLADLDLKDQRLVRSFLSLANAGDLVTNAMDRSGDAWAENTALTEEAAQRYATTESQLTMMRNQWRNVKDDIGSALLPAFRTLINILRDLVDKYGPTVVSFFEEHIVPAVETLGTALAQLISGDASGALETLFGEEIAGRIEEIVTAISDFVAQVATFVGEHSEAFKTALIAIGAVLAGAAIAAAITSIAGAITALANPITLIVAAVALLAAAWAEDWGGIRTFLTDVWENTLQPAFQDVAEWLSTNIPVAMEALKGFWEGTLQPAFQKMGEWLGEKIPTAIGTMREFWEKKLLPALKTVWAFIDENILPIFRTEAEIIGIVAELVGTALAGAWENFLLPALKTVWSFINESILPIFRDVWDFITEHLGPILEWLGDTVLAALSDTLEDVKLALGWVADKLGMVKEALSRIQLPDWLTPGSPTPFELGIRGIANAVQELGSIALPTLTTELKVQQMTMPAVPVSAGNAAASTSQTTYHIEVNIPGGGVRAREEARDGVLEALRAAGVA